jgi:hypothetical protein
MQLDGETNLKIKKALDETKGFNRDSLGGIRVRTPLGRGPGQGSAGVEDAAAAAKRDGRWRHCLQRVVSAMLSSGPLKGRLAARC